MEVGKELGVDALEYKDLERAHENITVVRD